MFFLGSLCLDPRRAVLPDVRGFPIASLFADFDSLDRLAGDVGTVSRFSSVPTAAIAWLSDACVSHPLVSPFKRVTTIGLTIGHQFQGNGRQRRRLRRVRILVIVVGK